MPDVFQQPAHYAGAVIITKWRVKMSNRVYVWDIFVRLFHWTLVLAFVTAYLSAEEIEWLHVYAGYIIAGLILFRLVWGVIGSPNARFSHFIRSPQAALDYIKGLIKGDEKNYIGHNPAGGWMVIMLLASLTLTTLSGLQMYALEGKGPLADTAGYDFSLIQSAQASDDDEHDENKGAEEQAEDWWEDVHEFLANFTVFLIFLHLLGVFVSSYRHRQNLPRAMISGYKEDI